MPSLEFANDVIYQSRPYLFSRQFHVNVNDKYSTFADLQYRVPKRSILGTMLFILYINDMPLAVD